MSTAGCTSVQGGRPYNEDAHLSDAHFLPTRTSCFQLHAVFDGHGGATVAQFCVERIPVTLRGILQSRLDVDALDRPGHASAQAVSVVKSALEEAVMDMNNQLMSADGKKFLWMGSTAVICLMYKQHVWVANTGDSRAVRGRAGGARDITQDHKASCPDELLRITQAGGQVINNGGPRLMGVLAVTRAVGDLALRNYGLTACPDTFHFQRDEEDEFLILASDGLWDVLSNPEAVQLVRRVFHKVSDSRSPCDACRVAASVLTRVALRKHSRDNITAMVIDLHPPNRTRTPPATRPSYVSTRQPLARTASSLPDSDSELETELARSSLAALMAAPKPTSSSSRPQPHPVPSLHIPSHLAAPRDMAMDTDLPLLPHPAAPTDPAQYHTFLSSTAAYPDDLNALLALQPHPDAAAMYYAYGWQSPEAVVPDDLALLAGYHHPSLDGFAPLLFEQQQLPQLVMAGPGEQHGKLAFDAGSMAQPGLPLHLQLPLQQQQQEEEEEDEEVPSLRAGPSQRAASPAGSSRGVSKQRQQGPGSKARLRLKHLEEAGSNAGVSPGKRRRASHEVDVTGSDMDAASMLPVLLYHPLPELYQGAYMLKPGAVRAC